MRWRQYHRKCKTDPMAPDFTHNLTNESLQTLHTCNSSWVLDRLSIEGTPKALPEHDSPFTYTNITNHSWRDLSIHEALVCLEKATLPHPSIDDIAHILDKCRIEKNKEHGLRLHAYMHDRGLDANTSLGNHLVLMLIEVGSLHEAEQVFDTLACRNEELWNRLIIGHVNHGSPQNALSLYKRMRSGDRVCLNAPTFVTLVKACAKVKDIKKGFEMHAEVARNGLLDNNLFIGTTLVDMYAKFGLLAKAQQVFEKLPDQNVVSWTTLIAGYAEHERGEEALHYFEQMQVKGVPANFVTFIACLKACSSIEAIDKGREIHSNIERQGLLGKDLFIGNALVDMYAKCGQLDEAWHVLSRLPARNVVSWTGLIGGYIKHGQSKKALDFFEQMQQEGVAPSAATYVYALKASGNLGAIHKGQEIHNEIEENGLLESNILVGSTLVSMYAKCDMFAKARYVFDRLSVQNVGSWNSLIAGYVEHGHDEEVLKCYEQMQLEGVSPNGITFICILKACGNIGDADMGEEIHDEVERQGLLKDPVIGNTLVDMYAKCGLLPTAQQVFDKLSVQTLSAWNALMAGYAEHGHGKEALDCFEQMQVEGVSPLPVTIACALKACIIIQDTDKGGELHAEIERQGLLDKNIVLGNTLVDMYAKAGLLSKAQQVFDRLLDRDIVTWSSLIAGYTKHGFAQEALKQFQLMQSEAVAPNAITFNSILKACGKDLVKGQEIHAEIERQGLMKSNVVAGSTLIEMYSKCGLLARAREVFDRLSSRNIMCWNALVAGYAEQGVGEEALNCIEQMQREGLCIEAGTFVYGLKACGSIKSITEGKKLHTAIEEKGLLNKDVILGSTLVDMYAKCGSLEKAQQVFDKLPVHGIVAWTTLIAGYAEHGKAEKALWLFEQMRIEGVLCDAFTLVCGLTACGRAGVAGRGKQIHSEIEGQELLGKDLVVANSLVDMYAKCGLLTTAQQVFDKLPAQSVVSWTALIAGYADHGYGEEALTCFEQMQVEGFLPNAATYVCSLKACGSLGGIDIGTELHAEIERQDLFDRDLTVGNAVVDMYSRCGRIIKAQQVFEKLPVRTTVSWTTIMAGYAQVGEIGRVLKFFRTMLDEGLRPNEVTFVVVLSACSRMGLINWSQTFFEAMSTEHGIVPVLEHYTCVISLLGRAGQLHKALFMTKKLVGLDITVWRTVLGACERWGSEEYGKCAFEHSLRVDATGKNVAYSINGELQE